MKIALITDAWLPQVNGVVTTLVELVAQLRVKGHEVLVIDPSQFSTMPCPGYKGIDLALLPKRKVTQLLDQFVPDAIHLATEGPLGWAARRYCLRRKRPFTTAFHTKFPEILNTAAHIPLTWGYGLFRHFHRPSQGVMVPSQGVLAQLRQKGFANLRQWTHGVDMTQFAFTAQPQSHPSLDGLARPIHLFVGRVSYEKNIDAFLALDLPGSKVVCGVGPLEAQLQAQYPNVRWIGILPRNELAKLYASSDVFVFPSWNDTFGLVLLEAMACGTPVAAYPADGPNEIIADSGAGTLSRDLQQACLRSAKIPRGMVRSRAQDFSWEEATRLFEQYLVPHAVVTSIPSRMDAQSQTS